MKDLVQRLRGDAGVMEKGFGMLERARHVRAAADRIEVLEAALREIEVALMPSETDHEAHALTLTRRALVQLP
jgi:hypothetical protein